MLKRHPNNSWPQTVVKVRTCFVSNYSPGAFGASAHFDDVFVRGSESDKPLATFKFPASDFSCVPTPNVVLVVVCERCVDGAIQTKPSDESAVSQVSNGSCTIIGQ
jgi:hypothetical protein